MDDPELANEMAQLIFEVTQLTHEGADDLAWNLLDLVKPHLSAQAFDQGFTACQLRVSQQLLALLPNKVDATNPYAKVS